MLTWIPTLTSRKLPIRQATKHGAWAWPNACKAASRLRLTVESSVVHFPLISAYPDLDPWPSFLSPATHMAHYGAARAQTKSSPPLAEFCTYYKESVNLQPLRTTPKPDPACASHREFCWILLRSGGNRISWTFSITDFLFRCQTTRLFGSIQKDRRDLGQWDSLLSGPC